jgi:alkanesulfonate monooxygenase SsuD/methylene tetrahydromethanopterin reductase-like flavin-dependent oxidoreductase (luciferase family)
VRFAVSIPPFADPATLLALAEDCEAAGWDAVLLWDHLRWDTHLDLEIHDPWALLSAMAVRTTRVRLGTCVTPLSRRRPHVLAKQLVTLDHLSGGRAMLGVGLGEPPDSDFSDFGDESDPRARGAMLDESLDILDRLVRGERVDVDGRHYSVHAEMKPASVQRPRPTIFVAGVMPNRRPLARALRWDGFFPIGSTSLLTPADLLAYVGVGGVGADRPEGWDLFAARTPGHSLAEWESAGVTWLVEGTWPVGDWVDDVRSRVRLGPPSA